MPNAKSTLLEDFLRRIHVIEPPKKSHLLRNTLLTVGLGGAAAAAGAAAMDPAKARNMVGQLKNNFNSAEMKVHEFINPKWVPPNVQQNWEANPNATGGDMSRKLQNLTQGSGTPVVSDKEIATQAAQDNAYYKTMLNWKSNPNATGGDMSRKLKNLTIGKDTNGVSTDDLKQYFIDEERTEDFTPPVYAPWVKGGNKVRSYDRKLKQVEKSDASDYKFVPSAIKKDYKAQVLTEGYSKLHPYQMVQGNPERMYNRKLKQVQNTFGYNGWIR